MAKHQVDVRKRRFTGPRPVEDEVPKPPKYLSRKARDVWKAAWQEFHFSAAEAALLEQGLRELDRAMEAEEVLRKDGITVETGADMVRAHPAVKIAKDSLGAYRAVLRDLGLRDVEGA